MKTLYKYNVILPPKYVRCLRKILKRDNPFICNKHSLTSMTIKEDSGMLEDESLDEYTKRVARAYKDNPPSDEDIAQKARENDAHERNKHADTKKAYEGYETPGLLYRDAHPEEAILEELKRRHPTPEEKSIDYEGIRENARDGYIPERDYHAFLKELPTEINTIYPRVFPTETPHPEDVKKFITAIILYRDGRNTAIRNEKSLEKTIVEYAVRDEQARNNAEDPLEPAEREEYQTAIALKYILTALDNPHQKTSALQEARTALHSLGKHTLACNLNKIYRAVQEFYAN